MNWQVYRWTWQVVSPLFVGTSPAGALNRCRLYVPARAVWGAVTAELARQEHENSRLPDYQAIGQWLKDACRFTYLYLAEQVDGRWLAWLPKYERDLGLAWRREDDASAARPHPDRAFRRRILHTRPATAIDPGSDTAADGSLRETECLQPRWRDSSGRDKGPVALVGYLLARNSAATGVFQRLSLIRSLFVGGDTRYGLGRLGRLSFDVAEPTHQIFGQELVAAGDEPIVRSAMALAHASASAGMSGALEALSGWDIGEQKALGSDGSPLWVPGSCAPKDAGSFQIDEHGIWHLVDGTAQTPTTGEIRS